MLTNDHPQDSIPAFVLGTLDIDEALMVNAHVVQCAACRAEVETFQAVLSALPYAATPRQPPAHIKQQLLARVAAAPTDRTSRPARATPRWTQAVTGGALALSLAFGYLIYDTNSRLAAIGGELARSQQSLAQLTERLGQSQQSIARLSEQHSNDQTTIARISTQRQQDQQALARMQEQIARDRQVAVFIAAPQTVHRALAGSDRRAHATMYMQPDSPEAVLVVEGMPRVQPGKIYQFWLARPGVQVPSVKFDVGEEGMTVLRIQAPAPVNQYDQVMVTVEQASGASSPSGEIVLSGSLNTALPAGESHAD
jgi:hypothetical protein